MTRGRKKDMTIPPSRALAQQRDYRARKAQYVYELEERCRRAEEENERLKKDLEWARAGLQTPSPFNADMTKASAELMQHLTSTAVSLARFQQVAFNSPLSTRPPMPPPASESPVASTSLPPGSFPPLPPYENRAPPLDVPTTSQPPIFPGAHTGQQPPMSPQTYADNGNSLPDPTPSPTLSLGSDCCGGFMDCSDLVEEAHQEAERRSRTSDLRFLPNQSEAR